MNYELDDPRYRSAVEAAQPQAYAPTIAPLSQIVREALAKRDPAFVANMQLTQSVLDNWQSREAFLRENPQVGMTLRAVTGSIELDFHAPADA